MSEPAHARTEVEIRRAARGGRGRGLRVGRDPRLVHHDHVLPARPLQKAQQVQAAAPCKGDEPQSVDRRIQNTAGAYVRMSAGTIPVARAMAVEGGGENPHTRVRNPVLGRDPGGGRTLQRHVVGVGMFGEKVEQRFLPVVVVRQFPCAAKEKKPPRKG